jgi:hypothetical protein
MTRLYGGNQEIRLAPTVIRHYTLAEGTVLLQPDVREYFLTPESVNAAAIIVALMAELPDKRKPPTLKNAAHDAVTRNRQPNACSFFAQRLYLLLRVVRVDLVRLAGHHVPAMAGAMRKMRVVSRCACECAHQM